MAGLGPKQVLFKLWYPNGGEATHIADFAGPPTPDENLRVMIQAAAVVTGDRVTASTEPYSPPIFSVCDKYIADMEEE